MGTAQLRNDKGPSCRNKNPVHGTVEGYEEKQEGVCASPAAADFNWLQLCRQVRLGKKRCSTRSQTDSIFGRSPVHHDERSRKGYQKVTTDGVKMCTARAGRRGKQVGQITHEHSRKNATKTGAVNVSESSLREIEERGITGGGEIHQNFWNTDTTAGSSQRTKPGTLRARRRPHFARRRAERERNALYGSIVPATTAGIAQRVPRPSGQSSIAPGACGREEPGAGIFATTRYMPIRTRRRW